MTPTTIDLHIPTTHSHQFRTRGRRVFNICLDLKMPCFAKDWPQTVGNISSKLLQGLILKEAYAGPYAIGGIQPHCISLSPVIVDGYMYTDDTFYYFNRLKTEGLYAIVYGESNYIHSLNSTRETPNMGLETAMERSPLADSVSWRIPYGAKTSSGDKAELAPKR